MTREENESLLNELNEKGYMFTCFDDIMKIGSKDKVLIPILLKWMEKLRDTHDQAWIARCLTVKGYTEATEVLLKTYKNISDGSSSDKWTIANAIGVISDKRYIDEYLEIISNKLNGRSRQMLIYGMGAFKEKRVKEMLISLLVDEEVNGHVIYALSKFNDISLIEELKPFLKHQMTWKRKEAEKAISKLEKLKHKE